MINLVNLLYLFKFLVPLFLNDKLVVRTVFTDFTWLMSSNTKPTLVLCTVCVLSVLVINFYWQYTEINKSNAMIRFLAKVKDNKLDNDIRLSNRKLTKRYKLKICIFINYSTKILHQVCFIGINLAFFSFHLIGYRLPDSGYHWTGIVFWSLITIIWAINYYATLVYVLGVVFSSLFYVKYKFIEINQLFDNLLKRRDSKPLLRAIRYHNSVSLLVKDMARYGNVLMFQIYYIGTPALALMLYNSQDPNGVFIWRLNLAITLVGLSISITYMVFFMSGVTRISNKPLDMMYKILIRMRLNRNQVLKVNEFIEHLSDGPKIGFYCLDLFPMNSLEFFKYIVFSCFCYIMILQRL